MPKMAALMAINFLVMLGFSFFYVAFPVHALGGLGWNVTDIGIYFAVLSLAMIAVQGPILARATKIMSERALMSLGGLSLGLGFAALFWPGTLAAYVAGGLIALGNGLMWPVFMSVLSKSAGTELQGAVQGFASSVGAVASIAGLIGGGVFYVTLGPTLFPIAAIIILIAAVLATTYTNGTLTWAHRIPIDVMVSAVRRACFGDETRLDNTTGRARWAVLRDFEFAGGVPSGTSARDAADALP